jgi:hypothetical protein
MGYGVWGMGMSRDIVVWVIVVRIIVVVIVVVIVRVNKL